MGREGEDSYLKQKMTCRGTTYVQSVVGYESVRTTVRHIFYHGQLDIHIMKLPAILMRGRIRKGNTIDTYVVYWYKSTLESISIRHCEVMYLPPHKIISSKI